MGERKVSGQFVRRVLGPFGLGVLLTLAGCASKPQPISQEEIVRRTQQLFDAVAPGNKQPWQETFSEDAIYFDEKGRSMDKKALVADVEPLPKGYSGTITVKNSKFHIEGNTAIHSYDSDETETIFGQELHARYHATDTWMCRDGKWQIVAGQVLRYYEDPAVGQADSQKLKGYVGTYQLAPGEQAAVTLEDGKLYLQRGSRPKVELLPEACDVFFRKGVEGRRVFHYANGKVDAMIDRRNNEDVVWKKVS